MTEPFYRVYCSDCYCEGCCNTIEHADLVEEARRIAKERDPSAFDSKVAASDKTVLKKGCKCTRTSCLKGYCECFKSGLLCGDHCKCTECKNHEGSKELQHINSMDIPDALHLALPLNHRVDQSFTPPLFNNGTGEQSRIVRELFNNSKLKTLASNMLDSVKQIEEPVTETISVDQEKIVLDTLAVFLEGVIKKVKK